MQHVQCFERWWWHQPPIERAGGGGDGRHAAQHGRLRPAHRYTPSVLHASVMMPAAMQSIQDDSCCEVERQGDPLAWLCARDDGRRAMMHGSSSGSPYCGWWTRGGGVGSVFSCSLAPFVGLSKCFFGVRRGPGAPGPARRRPDAMFAGTLSHCLNRLLAHLCTLTARLMAPAAYVLFAALALASRALAAPGEVLTNACDSGCSHAQRVWATRRLVGGARHR